MMKEHRKLEYLVRVYTDAVRAGSEGICQEGIGPGAKICRRKHWELGIAESVGAMDGREPTWKRDKGSAGREWPQTVGVGNAL